MIIVFKIIFSKPQFVLTAKPVCVFLNVPNVVRHATNTKRMLNCKPVRQHERGHRQTNV